MREFRLIGVATILLFCASAPVYAQIYGPDGEELPPVPDSPPTKGAPPIPAPSAKSPTSTAGTPAGASGMPPRIPAASSWPSHNSGWFPVRPWRVGFTAGAFVPIGTLSDRSAGNVWPSFSLTFETRRPDARNPQTLTLFLEGMATSRVFRDEFGDRMNEVRELYGVGLEGRRYVHPPGPLALYAGVGLGGYFLRRGVRNDTTSSPFLFFDDQSLVEGRYYLRPGYKLMLGMEENHGIFLEVRYLDAGALESVRYQGISANIGGRF